jgi:hypothetical protein
MLAAEGDSGDFRIKARNDHTAVAGSGNQHWQSWDMD